MGAAEQRNKSQAMAADLLKRGIWHGRRMTSPYPNSGGTTMVFAPGSSELEPQNVVASGRQYYLEARYKF